MSDNANARLQVTISGMVQGVNFRWFTQRRASELGLVGYVRNLSDGTVEVCAEGRRDSLDRLLDAVRTGPPSAVVENVDAEWSQASGDFHRFDIRF